MMGVKIETVANGVGSSSGGQQIRGCTNRKIKQVVVFVLGFGFDRNNALHVVV